MNRLLSLLLLTAAGWLWIPLAGQATPSSNDYVVIANTSLAGSEVPAGELKQIYLGAKTTVGGKRVEPVMARGGAAHQHFAHQCLGKTVAGLRNYYRMAVFSGKGSTPRTFASDEEIVQFVAATDGAIGYVSETTALHGVVRLRLR